jgi:hypothetical protein
LKAVPGQRDRNSDPATDWKNGKTHSLHFELSWESILDMMEKILHIPDAFPSSWIPLGCGGHQACGAGFALTETVRATDGLNGSVCFLVWPA